MLKNKINNLILHMWYYKKSYRKRLLITDLELLVIAALTIMKGFNSIYLAFIYFIVYIFSIADMISFSNSILACTPLKVKDTVNGTVLIMWAKSTIIIVLSLIISIISAINASSEFSYAEHLINILKYASVSYPMLKFLCTALYYVSKKYRTLVMYVTIAIFAFICFGLDKLTLLWGLGSFIILAIVISLVSYILIKRLSYEMIFFKEAER